MRIGIDARLYGPEHTGLGRYITNLVDNLINIDKRNEYVLFVNTKHSQSFLEYKNVKVVVVNTSIYSFAEQIILPFIYTKEKLDLLHIPHFNAPLFYFGKLVVTFHDLIKHASTGSATTTRPAWQHLVIRFSYYLLTFVVSRRAKKIIVPTEYVKKDVCKRLGISESKVVVTYESVDDNLKVVNLSRTQAQKTLYKYGLTQPFIIYTGNLYPHKNIDLLIEAVVKHNAKKEVDLCLGIVCARSVFYNRAAEKIKNYGAEEYIKLLGFVDDAELSRLYSIALCLVHPSKMEGFGLTGLEAMSVGLPVISSNASCLPEVYGSACLYFNPDSVDALNTAIEKLIGDASLREELSTMGKNQSKKYSWKRMANLTLKTYQDLQPK